MASIGKKIGQFRQWTGEKMGSTQKTETSEEYKRLEHETDLRKEFTEKIHEALTIYLKSMGKKKESLLTTDKAKKMPLEIMAEQMTHYGTMLSDESDYGRALVKFGQAHEKIANIQLEYITRVRDSYMNQISQIIHSMKDYMSLKAKLERRRLDFDAKLNKVHKSRKEKPELEEETRAAQGKYEESLTDITGKMIELNSNEEQQLEDLLCFMDAEVLYHRSCLEIISGLQQSLADMPRNPNLRSSTHIPRSVSSLSHGSIEIPSRSGSTEHLPQHLPQQLDRKLSYASNAGSMVYPMMGPNNTTVAAPAPSRQNSGASLPSYHSQSAPAIPTETKKETKQLRVLFDFDAEGPDELTIRKGQTLNLICEIDEGWWEGEMADGSGRAGMFPSNYVELLSSQPQNEAPPSLPTRADPEHIDQSYNHARPNSDINFSPTSVSQQPVENRPYSHISRLSFVPNNAPIPPQQQQQQQRVQSIYEPGRRASGGPGPIPASPAARRSMVQQSNGSGGGGAQMHVQNCGTCGCSEFVANAFRKDQCSNCYHRH